MSFEDAPQYQQPESQWHIRSSLRFCFCKLHGRNRSRSVVANANAPGRIQGLGAGGGTRTPQISPRGLNHALQLRPRNPVNVRAHRAALYKNTGRAGQASSFIEFVRPIAVYYYKVRHSQYYRQMLQARARSFIYGAKQCRRAFIRTAHVQCRKHLCACL